MARVRRFLLLIAWVAACWGAATQVGAAGPEHGRRLAAELTVMAGDARRLQLGRPGPQERQGLERRLAGALAALPLSLRRAGGDAGAVVELRVLHGRRDWKGFGALLQALRQRYPFDARPFLAVAPSDGLTRLGADIHRTVCAGCHDAPSPGDALLPAKRLPDQLASMSREEFAARLWLGVRGDKATAFANPFSERELAALIVWYSTPRR